MRNPFGSSLRIGISPQGVTVLRVNGRWRAGGKSVAVETRLPDDRAVVPEYLEIALRTALTEANCTGMRAHVVLADDLVRYFTVTPPRNAGSLRDCRAAAEMRFRSLYGDDGAGWRIDADWHARDPFMACAVPVSLLHALQTILAEKRVTPLTVVPQFIAAWNQWRGKLHDDAWFGVVHDHGMTVGAIHQRTLRTVRFLAAPDDATDLSWIAHRLAREALLLHLPAPVRLQLAGTLPAGSTPGPLGTLSCEYLEDASGTAAPPRFERHHAGQDRIAGMKRMRIDFAPPSIPATLARVHPAAWLVAAMAIAIGMHSAMTLIRLHRQQEHIQAGLQHVQAQIVRQTARSQPPPRIVIPEQQARAVNAAIAQLNLPWRNVLDALEAGTPATIALLAIEPDAAKQIVKGTAEAKGSDAMLAYVEDLKRQPFFTFVTLTRHEVNVQDPNKPIRFQFEAQWEMPR